MIQTRDELAKELRKILEEYGGCRLLWDDRIRIFLMNEDYLFLAAHVQRLVIEARIEELNEVSKTLDPYFQSTTQFKKVNNYLQYRIALLEFQLKGLTNENKNSKSC